MRKDIIGLTLGLAIGALAASTLSLGNRRVNEWETLTENDAPCGEFVTLPNGARMRFIVRGDSGAPIILIHGLMDSAEFWHNNIDALAQRHRVWAIDLIGFGYASRITQPIYSLNYFSRAVCDFMHRQNIERASVIGHSLGGAVTLQLARNYPAQVDRLIVIAPATFLLNSANALNPATRVPYVPRALMGFAMTSERARLRAWRNALGDPANLDPTDLDMRVRPMRVKRTADALVAMAASDWLSNLPNELARITARTLILWGNRDRAVPVQHANRHAAALPNADLLVLEKAGHIPHIEFPATVNPILLDFLNRVHES